MLREDLRKQAREIVRKKYKRRMDFLREFTDLDILCKKMGWKIEYNTIAKMNDGVALTTPYVEITLAVDESDGEIIYNKIYEMNVAFDDDILYSDVVEYLRDIKIEKVLNGKD
jgi:hypothetical protein